MSKRNPFLPASTQPVKKERRNPFLPATLKQETNLPALTPEVLLPQTPQEQDKTQLTAIERAVHEALESPVLQHFPRSALQRAFTHWRIEGHARVIDTLTRYLASAHASLQGLRAIKDEKIQLLLQYLDAEVQMKEREAHIAELDARVAEAKQRKRALDTDNPTPQPQEGSVFIGLPPKEE